MRSSTPELSDGFRGKLVTTKCCTCGNGCIRVRFVFRCVVNLDFGKDPVYVKNTSAKEDRGFTTCSAVVVFALPLPERSVFQRQCKSWTLVKMFFGGSIRRYSRGM